MEIQKFRKHIVPECILNPFGELTFNPVDPRGPMTGPRFHGFVEFVGDGFPTDDNDVPHCMQVVALVVKLRGPIPPMNPVFWLLAREKPTNDWREDQNHAHHDFVGVHASAALKVGFMPSDESPSATTIRLWRS